MVCRPERVGQRALTCNAEKEPTGKRGLRGYKNSEWISAAALLVVVPAHCVHCDDSPNDSMAGFRLPQAG
jgi:hypothetical protein